jgi:hypothetical protein
MTRRGITHPAPATTGIQHDTVTDEYLPFNY